MSNIKGFLQCRRVKHQVNHRCPVEFWLFEGEEKSKPSNCWIIELAVIYPGAECQVSHLSIAIQQVQIRPRKIKNQPDQQDWKE